jgi:hypothetical protein
MLKKRRNKMAHFYAEIKGNRGEATRMGTKESGIRGHIRGWDVGIKVYGSVGEDGEDEFTVYLTPGSNGGKSGKLIGVFKKEDL